MSLDLPDRSSPSPAILANCNTTTAPATSAAKLPAAPAQIAHPPSQHLQVLSASSPDSPPHIKPEQPDNDGPLIHPANIDVSRKAFFVRGQLTTVSARTPQELSRKVNELERRNVWAEELVTKTFKSEQNMQRLIEAYSSRDQPCSYLCAGTNLVIDERDRPPIADIIMGFLERRGKEVEHAHPRGTKYFLAAKLKLQEAFEARIRAAGDIPYGPGSEAFKRSL